MWLSKQANYISLTAPPASGNIRTLSRILNRGLNSCPYSLTLTVQLHYANEVCNLSTLVDAESAVILIHHQLIEDLQLYPKRSG